jgi:hypothetical protein
MNATSIRNRISSVPYFEHDRWSGGANGELATVLAIVDADEGIVGSNLMGVRVRESVDFFWYVQRNECPKMVEHARRAVSGATKCATSRSTARDAVGERPRIRVDPNEAWTPGQAVRMARALEAPKSTSWSSQWRAATSTDSHAYEPRLPSRSRRTRQRSDTPASSRLLSGMPQTPS